MKTKKKVYKKFVKECHRWIKKLGLLDWDVSYIHSADDDNFSQVRFNCEARWAEFGLNKEIDDTSDYVIKASAMHEVLELLLADLGWYAENRYVNREELENIRHAVIQRLINVQFNK